MILGIELVVGVSLLYILLLFMVGYYAEIRQSLGRSITSTPLIYSLSIGVYVTTWTYYGSVGKAATTGIDFLLIYLGPTLAASTWWFFLRKVVRISKENNITSIADFISSRYGKSQGLGLLVTLISIVGIMPYIALQLKAVSTTFDIICGYPYIELPFMHGASPLSIQTSFFAALVFSLFSVFFGARHLASSEYHEGLVAAIAVESVVKLIAFTCVGTFVTYGMFNGFGDVFTRIGKNADFHHLVVYGEADPSAYTTWLSLLVLSMSAVMFLPRQFHIMVIENSDEDHIKKAMWLFPAYMFAINVFVLPVAFGGIIATGGIVGADYFLLTLPLQSGHPWLALLAFIGGFSAAAGMVMVESVAISTMFLNYLVMPVLVRLKPRTWFPLLLINLKRLGILLVVFLGYLYQRMVGEAYMLVNIGLISFAAVTQFAPAFIGGLYWRRGNKTGACTGILLGFVVWFHTLLIPSFVRSGWLGADILQYGPLGLWFLKPTELFGLTGLDIWSNCLLWSLFFNIGGYVTCSLLFPQCENETDQAGKFVDVFMAGAEPGGQTKRFSKPVTTMQFVTLMSKFLGEPQARSAIREYLGDRDVDEAGIVSEFELPRLKLFTEKTLAGSVGAAAAGAIVETYLSELGSRMESVYDVFSTVRKSLVESKENLYVRLRASEILNQSLDIQTIMDDLLELIQKEFHFEVVAITRHHDGKFTICSNRGSGGSTECEDWLVTLKAYSPEEAALTKGYVVNDTWHIPDVRVRMKMAREEIASFAHIPIQRTGEPLMGMLSVFSKSLTGIFTEPFVNLLWSLAGQLAQAMTIVSETEAKERERKEKEKVLLENARVTRDLEIAKQIQLSLLPSALPQLPGVLFAAACVPAAQVGGDYYDFFVRSDHVVDVVIADVSGHGVGAALMMVEARSVLRAQAGPAATPPDVLNHLGDFLYEDLAKAELLISLFYATYNASTRELAYACAGQIRPLLSRKGEAGCRELEGDGSVLGVTRGGTFESRSIRLGSEDLLLLYTDGVVNASRGSGEYFGKGRLCDVLERDRALPPEKIVGHVYREVAAFCESDNFDDDMSVVLLKVV